MSKKVEALDLAELPSGKKLQYVRDGKMGRIQFNSGGELPKSLQGGWTDSKNAQTAVDGYVAQLAKLKAELEAKAEEEKSTAPEEPKALTAAEKRKATIAAKKATATEE